MLPLTGNNCDRFSPKQIDTLDSLHSFPDTFHIKLSLINVFESTKLRSPNLKISLVCVVLVSFE